MAQKFANAARGALDSALSDSATSLTIISGGSLFPVANTGASAIGPAADWFKLVIQDDTNIEIIFVRTHTSGSLTFSDILRGQEGTTARAFVAGSVVGCRPTAGDSADFGARQPATSVSDTPPANPVSGQEWFDGTSGISYIWVDDGTSGQWVDPTALLIAASSGGDGGGAFSGSMLVLDNALADDVTIGGSQSAFAMSPTIPSGRTAAIEDGGLLLVLDRDIGEVNTASNVGTGAGAVFKQKSGLDFQMKTIKAGSNITVTNGTDDITIASTVTPGEINTASSLGGTSLVGVKSGVDLPFKGLTAGTGVILSPSSVAITVTTVIISSSDPGAVGPGVIWVTP